MRQQELESILNEILEIDEANEFLQYIVNRIQREDYRGWHVSQHNRYDQDDIRQILEAVYSATQDYFAIPPGDIPQDVRLDNEYPEFQSIVDNINNRLSRGTHNSIKKNFFPDLEGMGFFQRENIDNQLQGKLTEKALAFIDPEQSMNQDSLFNDALEQLFGNKFSELAELIHLSDYSSEWFSINELMLILADDDPDIDKIELVKSFRSLNKYDSDAAIALLKKYANPDNFEADESQKRDFRNWRNQAQQIFSLLDSVRYFKVDSEGQKFKINSSHITPLYTSFKLRGMSISGYRSFREFSLDNMGNLTVLLGGNGSGKSNFIHIFRLLRWILNGGKLAEFIGNEGGASNHLFGGQKVTQDMSMQIDLETEMHHGGKSLNEYRLSLKHAKPDTLRVNEECFRFTNLSKHENPDDDGWICLDTGGANEPSIAVASQTSDFPKIRNIATVITNLLRRCSPFQFHDTSESSSMQSSCSIDDCQVLKGDGGNLAPILYRLQQEDLKRFEYVCHQIQRILPPFDTFILNPVGGKLLLQWSANWADMIFSPNFTSDGTLRFFALVTLLNLPDEMLPDIVLIDEPELGLHPAAITIIAAMIEQLSRKRQVILATQSPQFVNELGLDVVTTLDLIEGETKSRRINADDFKAWLKEDYKPGELWLKNLIGGRP